MNQGSKRRLLQLRSVSCRALSLEPDEGCYFTLHTAPPSQMVSLPSSLGGGSQAELHANRPTIYRSELVTGTINPEWRPLDFTDLGYHTSDLYDTVSITLQIHATKVPGNGAPMEMQRPALFPLLHDGGIDDDDDDEAVVHQDQEIHATTTIVAADNTIEGLKQQQYTNGGAVQDGDKLEMEGNGHPQQLSPLDLKEKQDEPKVASSSHDESLLPLEDSSSSSMGTDVSSQVKVQQVEDLLLPQCGVRIVSRHLIDLCRLVPIEDDLPALPYPIDPGTVLLEFDDGRVCLYPIPAAQQAQQAQQESKLSSGSSSAPPSPRKDPNSNLTKEESVEGGGLLDPQQAQQQDQEHQQPRSRRFASLFVPKILQRSSGRADEATNVDSQDPITSVGSLHQHQQSIGPSSERARVLTITTLHTQVTSLVYLQEEIQRVHHRTSELKAQLRGLLTSQEAAQCQVEEIGAARDAAAEHARQATVLSSRLERVKLRIEEVVRLGAVRSQALATTLKLMTGAEKRRHDGEAVLHGPQGWGHFVALSSHLSFEQSFTVVSLGALLRLGPISVDVPQAPPGGYLEDRLEVGWAGALGGVGGGRKGVVRGGVGAWAGAPSSSLFKQETRLAIGGLELNPSVWKKAIEQDGYDWDTTEDREAGIALGHIAYMVCKLAEYRGVVLRYPIKFRGSTSSIVDGYPPIGPWCLDPSTPAAVRINPTGNTSTSSGGTGGGSFFFSRAEASESSQLPVEYPLFCGSNRERPRFAVAVFLLNKDIGQLLQRHGLTAAGPSHIVHNLYKLVLAAEACLHAQREV